MKPIIVALLMSLVSILWAEDTSIASQTVDLPLGFEEGCGRVKCANAMELVREQGIDSQLFIIRPQKSEPPWTLTIINDHRLEPIKAKADRQREWWPFGILTTLHIHNNADGSVWAESLISTGRVLEPDAQTGTFTASGPRSKAHFKFWFANETLVESTMTSLEFIKVQRSQK